ncbi:hypothetical protein [Pseudonocardia sp. MH-G8]|uniref:hypothetical protein n=1 Tax=Pseudonocardia sp. MH-G8 TaxID=1854588 RepID=UPI000BA05B8A|nr:hypothetical protein [Pseudonocardia sp. MH-G8]OZM81020.1 hypothetical protein CFP66_16570 [Pseudonocardia sp. MH-G8]
MAAVQRPAATPVRDVPAPGQAAEYLRTFHGQLIPGLLPDLPDIDHTEQLTSAVYLDERVDVERYLAVMEQVTAQAETPVGSQDMLRRLSREWD